MPETARSPQNRAEGLSGGAGKNSYVKSGHLAGSAGFAALSAELTPVRLFYCLP